MILIGICGASGSGKSTLAASLQNALGRHCLILTQDCYYKDNSHLPFEQRQQVNYDEPDSFDHAALLADVQALMAGRNITRKGYDYEQHCRADTDEVITPPDVLIIEGIHCFYDPALRELMYLKLYVDVDPDICLLRRIERDIVTRGRGIADISYQYQHSVRPMFIQYIRDYIKLADFSLADSRNPRIVEILSGYIADELHKRGRT